jgi:2-succinyl-6-hydroxy-2,4-cyclohexadiene-1-carboxylate synthase
VLRVAGAEDAPYRGHAAAMAARLPDARVAIVPDAGHATHLENPAAFRAAVEAFLDRAAPPAA